MHLNKGCMRRLKQLSYVHPSQTQAITYARGWWWAEKAGIRASALLPVCVGLMLLLSLQTWQHQLDLGSQEEEAKAWPCSCPSVLLSAAMRDWKRACIVLVYWTCYTIPSLSYWGSHSKALRSWFPDPRNSHVMLLVFSSLVSVGIQRGWRYALAWVLQFRACWRKGASCFV